MERLQPVLLLVLRTIVGSLLALALGMFGVGMGWILYVFFGFTTYTALLAMMMGGATLGAAAGGFLARLRLDNNTLPMLLVTAAVLLVAGVAGAWGGFQFGSQQEVPCCTGPEFRPMTYMVLGATVVTNGVALLLGIVQTLRQVTTQWRPARPGPYRR
jgi:hypothetical protein